MKRFLLPLSSLLLIVACGDDSSSAFDAWSENLSSSLALSSSENAPTSSSWREAIGSSSSKIDGGSEAAMTSSSSSRLVPDLESSSSMDSISSSSFQKDNSSSSVAASSSSIRNDVSSSSQNVILSSSDNSTSSSTGSSNSSSSSWIASSSSNSRNDVSSSSDSIASSSSANVPMSSSESVPLSSSWSEAIGSSSSSSSEILTDLSKIFDIRIPRDSVYTCEMPWGDGTMTASLSQHDVICTYDYNGERGFLYVQLTPTSCDGGLSLTPGSYDVDKVQFYVNGKFADVSNVNYEWGSNHHVEHLQFAYKGNIFRYAQSTMGWGGRPCQNMDCLKVFESDGKTYVENGCNERSLPIVCRNINSKGEVVSDYTDTYKVCEGDPRTLGYDVEY